MLIEGVKYYADQPRMLGKTFLRLVRFNNSYLRSKKKKANNRITHRFSYIVSKERDFDKHVAYCRDEPSAQEFLQANDEVRDYFEVSKIFFP